MKRLKENIQKDVHEVLDKYLAWKLLWTVEHEIMANVEWYLAHMEDEDHD